MRGDGRQEKGERGGEGVREGEKGKHEKDGIEGEVLLVGVVWKNERGEGEVSVDGEGKGGGRYWGL